MMFIIHINGLYVSEFTTYDGEWSIVLTPSRNKAKRFTDENSANSVASNIGWYGLPMVVEFDNG